MKKKWFLGIGIMVLVVGVIGGIKAFEIFRLINHYKAQKMPAMLVSTATAEAVTWHPYLTSTGTLVAKSGVDLMPQVSGIVTQILFDSGQTVQAGDTLVILDTAVLQAQLDNAQAALKLAKIGFERQATLFKEAATSQSEYDAAQANFNQNQATVDQYQALLSQKIIKAPFSGRLGIRKINLGQYVDPSSVISTLQQLDPIFVDFSIPQDNLSQVFSGQPVQISVPTYPNQVYQGKVTAISPKIDPNTRAVSVRAEFSNGDLKHILLPGMFVSVHVLLPTQDQVVTIPQSAVTYTLYGDSVFVVIPQSKEESEASRIPQVYSGSQVKEVSIKTGESRDQNVVVLEGLKAGDVVVSAGQVKLQSGFAVTPDKIHS